MNSNYEKMMRLAVEVKFDCYELVNLLKALEMVPQTGDWHGQIIGKLMDALNQQGFYVPASKLGYYFNTKHDEYSEKQGLIPLDWDANPMSLNDVRRHLEWKEKKND